MIGLRLKQALRGLFTAPYSSLKHSICLTLPNNKDALLLCIPLCYTHAHEHTFTHKQARINTRDHRRTHANIHCHSPLLIHSVTMSFRPNLIHSSTSPFFHFYDFLRIANNCSLSYYTLKYTQKGQECDPKSRLILRKRILEDKHTANYWTIFAILRISITPYFLFSCRRS